MFGAIPAALTYYWRMKMPETARYTALVAKNTKQAAADMAKKCFRLIWRQNKRKLSSCREREGMILVCLLSNLFAAMDFTYLKPLALGFCWTLHSTGRIRFKSKRKFSVLLGIGQNKTMNAVEEVFRIARAHTLIALCNTVPGYWFTVAFIDKMGRFAIQWMGFFFITVFMFALTIPYHHWTLPDNRIGFIVMYSFTFFFANFCPNDTASNKDGMPTCPEGYQLQLARQGQWWVHSGSYMLQKLLELGIHL